MLENQLAAITFLAIFSILGSILSAWSKQPVVLGLMVLGALIGPNLFGFVEDASIINMMIEFGTILFLFSIGLEFSLKKLMQTGHQAVMVSLYKVGIMFFLGFTAIMIFGFDATTAAFYGVALSFSSTMIILNVMKQKQAINRKEVPVIMGVLILEDIFGVIALAFFATMKEAGIGGLAASIENLIISFGVLIALYVFASKFAERLIKKVTVNSGEEVITFISIGLCAGFALIAYALGLSPAAGAFLAGSVVSTFQESKKFEHSIKPHSILFTSFFFLAIGTMIDFKSIATQIHIILTTLVIIFLGLPIAMGISTKLFAGFNDKSAFFSSFAMLPPGVFSLLVARESLAYGTQIDLVSIISVVLLLMSFIMSIMMSFEYNIKYPRIINKKVDSIAGFINGFYSRLYIENLQTKKFNRRMKILTISISITLFVLMLTLKISSNFSNVFKIIIYSVIGVILIYLISILKKNLDSLSILSANIIADNQSGKAERLAKKSSYFLLNANIIFVLGLFSPLIIYAIDGTIIYLLGSLLLIVIGMYLFMKAERIIRIPTTIKKIKFESRKIIK